MIARDPMLPWQIGQWRASSLEKLGLGNFSLTVVFVVASDVFTCFLFVSLYREFKVWKFDAGGIGGSEPFFALFPWHVWQVDGVFVSDVEHEACHMQAASHVGFFSAEDHLEDPAVQAYFATWPREVMTCCHHCCEAAEASLDLSITDVWTFFKLLDSDMEAEISPDSWLHFHSFCIIGVRVRVMLKCSTYRLTKELHDNTSIVSSIELVGGSSDRLLIRKRSVSSQLRHVLAPFRQRTI